MDLSLFSSTSSEPSNPEVGLRQRQRGRGRGRGKGRGRRGRGKKDGTHIVLQQREENISSKIDALNENEVRNLLKEAAKKNPGLILSILDRQQLPERGHHPDADGAAPDWCVCHACREMPTQVERMCCGYNPDNCTSLLPDFELLVLNEAVLDIARAYRQDVLVAPLDNNWSRGHRHTAYRQYILWQHGRLGIGIRRTIPSCCVWKIRDRYPDEFGQYVGFQSARI
ncbi:P2X purinoceptor 7-like [Antedon mediterranea]|uniref:P2X purinoceptor 7-like n=1 Tax=Antedon mediterranea TaxID=105859 RepID=UPI003AF55CB2